MTHHTQNGSARIGVVLSSGGVRGVFAHTGFLQAIETLGIRVSASAGCSAGALVGGFIASGTPLQRWTETLARVDSCAFWTPDPLPRILWRLVGHRGRGYTGLSDTRAALEFTRNNLTVNDFGACRFPFHTLATNLRTGGKTFFSEGELAPRMVASAALPILYRPIKIDDEYYCDGAVIDFAPTDAICCRHHLDVVIVHHVTRQPDESEKLETAFEKPWAMLEVINRLVFRERPWYLTGKPLSVHACPCHCGAIIVVLEPELASMRWPDPSGGQAVLDAARQQAERQLRPWLGALEDDPRKRMREELITESGKNADSCSTNEGKHNA